MQCKVMAVKNFSQPQTKKQIRSFLGFCGYYQKFIPNFSTKASPLSDLTKKDILKTVRWTPKCETAFHQLKEALLKTPVLMTPDWSRPFVLQTDASSTGLGFVLKQIDEKGNEHPLAFGSKKLLPREWWFCHQVWGSGNCDRDQTLPNIFGGHSVHCANGP